MIVFSYVRTPYRSVRWGNTRDEGHQYENTSQATGGVGTVPGLRPGTRPEA